MKNIINFTLFLALWFLLIWCWSNSGVNNNLWNDGWIKKNNGSQVKEETFSNWKQNIIKLQLKNGRDYVNKINCNKYDKEWKQYCESEKSELAKIVNEVTWESVQKKWHEYIIKFDCDNLNNEVNKKLCSDYKKNYSSSWVFIWDVKWVWAPLNNFSYLSWDEFIKYNCNSIENKTQIELCQKKQEKYKFVENYFKNMTKEQIISFDCSKLKAEKSSSTCKTYIDFIKK